MRRQRMSWKRGGAAGRVVDEDSAQQLERDAAADPNHPLTLARRVFSYHSFNYKQTGSQESYRIAEEMARTIDSMIPRTSKYKLSKE